MTKQLDELDTRVPHDQANHLTKIEYQIGKVLTEP